MGIESNLKSRHCNLCGSLNHEFLFSSYDRMFQVQDYYKLYRCTDCGLIFISPQPSKGTLSKHYCKDKYEVLTESKDFHERRIFTLMECLYQYCYVGNSPKSLRFVSYPFYPFRPMFRTLKFVEKGNFLDVGCAMGYFLLIAKYLGMNPYGVEPWDFDKKLSEDYNLNIFNGTLLEAKYESDFFDVVTLNHVLEHVDNPSEIMEELYRILKPSGYLIMGVPISDSIAFKLFGTFWGQLDTPRHLFIFSKMTLKRYAEKFSFDIVDIRYNSTPSYQFICSFVYIAEQFTKRSFRRELTQNVFLNFLFSPISALLNLIRCGDQCEIILTKK